MKKKLVALLCAAAMVMVPSMGVLAAEPNEAPGDSQKPVVTSDPEVQTSLSGTNQPTGTGAITQTPTTPSKVTKPGTTEPGTTEPGTTEPGTTEPAVTEGNVISHTLTQKGSQDPSGNPAAGQAVGDKPVLAVQSNSALGPQAVAMDNGDNKVDGYATIGIGNNGGQLQDGVPYTPEGSTGKITWHKDTNTLEFDNFVLKVEESVYIGTIGDATLILTGENCIVSKGNSIFISNFDGNLTIKGGGSLTMDSANSAILEVGGSLNIEGVDITVNSSDGSEAAGLMLGDTEIDIDQNQISKNAINITNSTVGGEKMQIVSYGGINFNENSKVTASSAGEVPAITALGKIVFNLSGDGWVKATASNNEDAVKEAIVSGSGIEFLNGNRIVNLMGGKVAYNSEGGYWFIADAEGNPAGYVVVEGPEQVKAQATANTSTKIVKNGVQTGDYAQTGLWLVIMLAAIGDIAVAIKKRRA